MLVGWSKRDVYWGLGVFSELLAEEVHYGAVLLLRALNADFLC